MSLLILLKNVSKYGFVKNSATMLEMTMTLLLDQSYSRPKMAATLDPSPDLLLSPLGPRVTEGAWQVAP